MLSKKMPLRWYKERDKQIEKSDKEHNDIMRKLAAEQDRDREILTPDQWSEKYLSLPTPYRFYEIKNG